jgi:hypothetical protein
MDDIKKPSFIKALDKDVLEGAVGENQPAPV